ncbi:MAG: hypothetical protein ACNS62_00780 [Candidatus Cyclobacteriaceae bacterium M3_2C_046]
MNIQFYNYNRSNMANYIIDMLICGAIYVGMVYFIVRLIKNHKFKRRGRSDDDDGGIEFFNEPDLDLPPGVTLPDNGPDMKVKLDEKDEVLI